MNNKGQSLIEYLIIVAIVAIGSIGIVKVMGETIYVRFTNITNALQNRSNEIQPTQVDQEHYRQRGLDDFFRNAGRSDTH